jgi:hypothetical protein
MHRLMKLSPRIVSAPGHGTSLMLTLLNEEGSSEDWQNAEKFHQPLNHATDAIRSLEFEIQGFLSFEPLVAHFSLARLSHSPA